MKDRAQQDLKNERAQCEPEPRESAVRGLEPHEQEPRELATQELAAIVMAAGLSRRAGFDKLIAPVGGRALYRHILETLSSLPWAHVLVVSENQAIKETAEALGFWVIPNPEAHSGKASTIRRGVQALLEMTPKKPMELLADEARARETRARARETGAPKGIAFFVCDQPHISRETILSLAERFLEKGDHIVYPLYPKEKGANGRTFERGNPMIFPICLAEDLQRLQGDQGGAKLLDRHLNEGLVLGSAEEAKDYDVASDFEAH